MNEMLDQVPNASLRSDEFFKWLAGEMKVSDRNQSLDKRSRAQRKRNLTTNQAKNNKYQEEIDNSPGGKALNAMKLLLIERERLREKFKVVCG